MTKLIKKMNFFIIMTLVIVNFSLIAATGTSDTAAWAKIIRNTVGKNPIVGHALVGDNIYPPGSTVIFAAYSTLWRNYIGESKDYEIATKIAIFVAYIFVVISYLKFAHGVKNNFSWKENLLIILTVYSIFINAQGLAYIDSFVIPFLILSTLFLYQKKYALSGFFLGIACSIKWQPMVFIPFYLASFIEFKNLRLIINRRVVIFLMALIIIPGILWTDLYFTPGGYDTIIKSTNFVKYPNALSGLALNLNWIVTYMIHIFYPVEYYSLPFLKGNNSIVSSVPFPIYSPRWNFIFIYTLIFIRFFFSSRGLEKFLAALVMVFFSHFILNEGVHEEHLIYVVVFSLMLFFTSPTQSNQKILILFDIMNIVNLIFFYSFTGANNFIKVFFGFDITIWFAVYFVIIYFWLLVNYFKKGRFELKPD